MSYSDRVSNPELFTHFCNLDDTENTNSDLACCEWKEKPGKLEILIDSLEDMTIPVTLCPICGYKPKEETMSLDLINNILVDLYVEYKQALRNHMTNEATQLFQQIKYYEEKREAEERGESITIKMNKVS